MSEFPLVSIVLPIHNGARYLPESLASIVAQTYSEWELICVDDASTDDTPEILAKWAAREKRIRVIRHQQNQRLPGALNTGFAAATGDLLTWTSDDNLYRPQAIATFVHYLQVNPDVEFVYSDHALIDAEGSITGLTEAPKPEGLITGTDGLASFLYRRSVYERVGAYADDLFLAEDYDYWLRVVAAGCVMAPIHETLYAYRFHSRSLTDTYREQAFQAAERSLLRNAAAITYRYPHVRGGIYLRLASLASWRNQRAKTIYYTLRSLPYQPTKAAEQIQAYVQRRIDRNSVTAFRQVVRR